MKSAIRRSFGTVMASVVLLGVAGASAVASNVKVFAAASLTDVLEVIAQKFEAQGGGHIQFNFAGSNVLARQILQGAPVDLFLSADEAEMDAVSNSGLLAEGTRHDLLSNSLVIIVPEDSNLKVLSASNLANSSFKRIALGDPEMVPAGVYAKAFLEKEGIWDSVRNKVIPAANVRAALSAVSAGEADAGIVYKTDALISKGTKVAYEISAAEGPRIRYPVALVKGAENSIEAKKFLDYMRSPDAARVFAQYGFVTTK
jgi:molybdate transport system substrate-binding protein